MIDTNLNYKSDHNYSGLIKIRNIVDDNCSYYEDNEGKKELIEFKINDHQKILSQVVIYYFWIQNIKKRKYCLLIKLFIIRFF